MNRTRLMVVGIHIGDVYSQCGISTHRTRLEYRGLSKTHQLEPNTILLNKESEFIAFGYNAEKTYTDLQHDGKHKDLLYFRTFTWTVDKDYKNGEFIKAYDRETDILFITLLFEILNYYKREAFVTFKEAGAIVVESDVQFVVSFSDYLLNSYEDICFQACANVFDGDVKVLSESEAGILCYQMKLGSKPKLRYVAINCSRRQIFLKGSTTECPPVWNSNFDDTSLGTAIQRFVNKYFSIIKQKYHFNDFYQELLLKLKGVKDPSRISSIKHYADIFETDEIREAFARSEYADCYKIILDKIRIQNTVLIDILHEAFQPFAQSLSLLHNVVEEDISRGNINALLPFGEMSEFMYIQSLLQNTFRSCSFVTTGYSAMDCILIGALMSGYSTDISCTSSVVSKHERFEDGYFIRTHTKLQSEFLQMILSTDKTLNQNVLQGDAGRLSNQEITEGSMLTDPNRPTKIAEKFDDLFHGEWDECYTSLQKDGKDKLVSVNILVTILKQSHQACEHFMTKQIKRLESILTQHQPKNDKKICVSRTFSSGTFKSIQLLRRRNVQKYLSEIYEDSVCLLRKECNLSDNQIKFCETYIRKCVLNCFYMLTSEKPMYMKWTFYQGDVIDSLSLENFKSEGTRVDFMVWPALYLFYGGPLLNKGFVKAMK
ncbi:unnamed protein product [Mytilus coruscus]|uniref:Mitochondria-eating protein C-terminal domain-containing protein n=1 Tax=Mytilus coruscus TaxID=42192 RepID=A0A6J8F4M8_MYTCO|nr:unnamed protein product [Mytilus coruscus]